MQSVLGVAMEVWYIKEILPSQNLKETPDPHYTTVDYWYDLELDAGAKIIAGEWYHDIHPDFLWTPVPGVPFVTHFDHSTTEQWNNPNSPIPTSWVVEARSWSAQGKPLSQVVDSLINFANI